ncbi:MAG: ROK family protein, partial [Salinibacterium sp.]|nr:ROK family protein [Salinibacterium sp.]
IPPFGCDTGKVYQTFDELPPVAWRPDEVRALPGCDILKVPLFNDLGGVAAAVRPELRTFLESQRSDSPRAHVTGSGSTLFLLCAEGEEGPLAAQWSELTASMGAQTLATRLSKVHERVYWLYTARRGQRFPPSETPANKWTGPDLRPRAGAGSGCPAMASDKPVIGIDLGGTNMQVGVVPGGEGADRTKLLGRSRSKTKAEQGLEPVLDRIVETVHKACEHAGLQPSDLLGAGIGAPGAVDPTTGTVLEAPNLRWENTPLADLLSEKLGMPVIVDNDVNSAAWGEFVAGAGRGTDDMIAAWIGTGIGGGLVLRGELYYGHFLTAGELGHMQILPNNPPGNRSVEHNCSRTAIVEDIARMVRSNHDSIIYELAGDHPDRIKSKYVAKANAEGDEMTRRVVDHAADLLGAQLAGIVTLLSLGRIVIGGGLAEAMGEDIVNVIRKSVHERVFPDKCRAVEVVCSELMDDAGLVGAALLAERKLLDA